MALEAAPPDAADDDAPAGGVTEDALLGGRIVLAQPAGGYRVAIDPVLLAAAVPARPGERVFDAGAGTGAAALCLAARVPGARVVGVEIDPALHRLARRNVARNGLDDRVEVLAGGVEEAPGRLGAGSFDHVMTNPPYLPGGAGTPPHPRRAGARVEGGRGLAGWLADCLALLKPRGRLTLVHRADRLDQVAVALLGGGAGGLIVVPLWPTERAPAAKRVIVQARKGARGPMRLARGLVLHHLDGGFTSAAEAVLRHGGALPIGGDGRGQG